MDSNVFPGGITIVYQLPDGRPGVVTVPAPPVEVFQGVIVRFGERSVPGVTENTVISITERILSGVTKVIG